MSEELKKYFELMKERPEQFRPSDMICIETDLDRIQNYERETGKKIGVIYRSAYNIFVVDLIRTNNGTYYTYERLLPAVKVGAVVALVMCQNRFVLLKQYRHAIRDFQYAFPRGYGEEGVNAEENVRKEIQEEIGATVIGTEYLGTVVADSGLCGNAVSVFICEVENVIEKYGYEGIESMVMLEEEELAAWIQNGDITDGFSLAAYGLYKARLLNI